MNDACVIQKSRLECRRTELFETPGCPLSNRARGLVYPAAAPRSPLGPPSIMAIEGRPWQYCRGDTSGTRTAMRPIERSVRLTHCRSMSN